MIRISESQAAYAARPFAVYWKDSHFAGEFRFVTIDEAFEYVWQQWERIQHEVRTTRCAASNLWASELITPEGSVQLAYVVLANNVSSYACRGRGLRPDRSGGTDMKKHFNEEVCHRSDEYFVRGRYFEKDHTPHWLRSFETQNGYVDVSFQGHRTAKHVRLIIREGHDKSHKEAWVTFDEPAARELRDLLNAVLDPATPQKEPTDG